MGTRPRKVLGAHRAQSDRALAPTPVSRKSVDAREEVPAASPRLEDLRLGPQARTGGEGGAGGTSALARLLAELASAPWRPLEPPSAWSSPGVPGRVAHARASEAREAVQGGREGGVQRPGAGPWPSIFPGRSPRAPTWG